MRRHTPTLPLFLFFVLLPLIIGQTSASPTWLKTGIYAKYVSSSPPIGCIFFSNGTKLRFDTLASPAIFRWAVLQPDDEVTCLNVSLSIEGDALKTEPDGAIWQGHVEYRKFLLFGVDLQTGEASLNDEKLGKMSFWAGSNVAVGQRIELFSTPSDFIEGNVSGLKSVNVGGRQVDSYEVKVFKLDPFVFADYSYDQKTGLALTYTLLGPFEVRSDGSCTYQFLNGTTYNITSYARTRLSELLGLEYEYPMILDETNIELGRDQHPMFPQIYAYAFVGIFASLSVAFVLISKRQHKKLVRHNARR